MPRLPLFSLLTFTLITPQLWGDVITPPEPPEVPARGYILEDFGSHRTLGSKNADERLEPASITKVMTAYVAFAALETGNISMDDTVKISEKAWRMGGSRSFVEVGTQVRVEDLLRGMIVQSGNDATVALAEHIAGSEDTFVTLMNQETQKLGLKGTHYENSTGMPGDEHYTTARDIITLSTALISRFPERYKMFAERSFTFNGITQQNRNPLLAWDESVDGLKTGHTNAAGYCLASSAKRGDMRLLAVVLGTDSPKARGQSSQELLTYGFRFFETVQQHTGDVAIAQARVWKGDVETLSLGVADDLFLTVPKGEGSKLETVLDIEKRIIAPVQAGDACGTVRIMLGEEILAERPLIALTPMAEGSLWQQLRDEALLYFE